MPARSRVVLLIFGLLAAVNLVAVDTFLVSDWWMKRNAKAQLIEQSQDVSPAAQSQSVAACSPSCISLIEEATASMTLATPTPTKPTTVPAVKNRQKEFYIPLGTGYTESNQWTDVDGTDTTINPANYGKIVQVTFQASMHIPVANGTVYARLFNVTANHPVWFSEIGTGEGSTTTVSSGNITLDQGDNLYRVQIQTSLQYPSYLDFSRIRILTE